MAVKKGVLACLYLQHMYDFVTKLDLHINFNAKKIIIDSVFLVEIEALQMRIAHFTLRRRKNDDKVLQR